MIQALLFNYSFYEIHPKFLNSISMFFRSVFLNASNYRSNLDNNI